MVWFFAFNASEASRNGRIPMSFRSCSKMRHNSMLCCSSSITLHLGQKRFLGSSMRLRPTRNPSIASWWDEIRKRTQALANGLGKERYGAMCCGIGGSMMASALHSAHTSSLRVRSIFRRLVCCLPIESCEKFNFSIEHKLLPLV
jgi:hypothetical protein